MWKKGWRKGKGTGKDYATVLTVLWQPLGQWLGRNQFVKKNITNGLLRVAGSPIPELRVFPVRHGNFSVWLEFSAKVGAVVQIFFSWVGKVSRCIWFQHCWWNCVYGWELPLCVLHPQLPLPIPCKPCTGLGEEQWDTSTQLACATELSHTFSPCRNIHHFWVF